MVYVAPTYKQQLKCVKPTVKTVKQWSVNAMETLCGCFERTDWGVFKEAATDIHEYTDTVSDYITFCEGLCIPTKTITSCPNDKPWFNTDIKHRRNKMRTKIMTKTNTRKRDMQRKRPSRPARPKTVTSLRRISPPTTLRTFGRVIRSVKAITNYKPSPKNTTATDTNLPDRLNYLYNRFDKLNTTSPSFSLASCDR